MATAVGKKFPNLFVDAMNEMGDTFKVNVLEEAVSNKKKKLYCFGTQKILHSFVQQNCMLFKQQLVSSKKETLL